MVNCFCSQEYCVELAKRIYSACGLFVGKDIKVRISTESTLHCMTKAVAIRKTNVTSINITPERCPRHHTVSWEMLGTSRSTPALAERTVPISY